MTADTSSRYGSVIKRSDGRCTVIFERHLPHPIEKVWEAITRPDHLARWFPGISIELRQGGKFSIRFGGDCEGPVHVSGEVALYEPPRRLQLGSMLYELEREGAGCLLRFSDVLQFNGARSNTDIANSVLAGWHNYLDRLEEFLAGGATTEPRPELDYAQIQVAGRSDVEDAPRQD
jgi:hypothetical protein